MHAMMTYQTILAVLGEDTDSRSRLGIAIGLARDFDARLVGMYLSNAPVITPSVAAVLPDEVVARYLSGSGDAQYAAEQAFRDAAKTADWRDIEWRAPSGPPIEAAVAHGRCADLIVIGQPQAGEAGSGFASQLVSAALMETGRPLLVVPYVGVPESIGKHVLVAWDGGREASRALADAMPLLRRAARVTVGCLDPGASEHGADAAGRERLAGYLRRHGIGAGIEYDRLGPGDIPVGDWLLSRVADRGGDLVVMGGYGHPRWREHVLGGATRTLLTSMTVPVFMAH
ncbi:MAG TPA: universal stress protein [Casimicrobiaceae bacterium]|nr:universal stress protein [Casimicrobiaceae bacterium]